MSNNSGNSTFELIIVVLLMFLPLILLLYVGGQIDKTKEKQMEKCLEKSNDYKDCHDLILK